jgi:hypothetical protein
MDRDRTAARARRPSTNDGQIPWPFGPGFPSSDPHRTPPKGASCCADRDRSAGLIRLDTVDREAMTQTTEQPPPRPAPNKATERLAARQDEPLQVLIDHDSGRVLVRDRGEPIGYELRMRERFGRAWGLGWVELLLRDEGAVVETGVSAAEVMAVARDAGRALEVAELSRWAARQLVESGDRVAAHGEAPAGRAAPGSSSSASRCGRCRRGCWSGSRPARRSSRCASAAASSTATAGSTRPGCSAAPAYSPTAARAAARYAAPAPRATRCSAARARGGRDARGVRGLMGAKDRRRLAEELVATYADAEDRRHRIVVRGRLVLDLCARRPPTWSSRG